MPLSNSLSLHVSRQHVGHDLDSAGCQSSDIPEICFDFFFYEQSSADNKTAKNYLAYKELARGISLIY